MLNSRIKCLGLDSTAGYVWKCHTNFSFHAVSVHPAAMNTWWKEKYWNIMIGYRCRKCTEFYPEEKRVCFNTRDVIAHSLLNWWGYLNCRYVHLYLSYLHLHYYLLWNLCKVSEVQYVRWVRCSEAGWNYIKVREYNDTKILGKVRFERNYSSYNTSWWPLAPLKIGSFRCWQKKTFLNMVRCIIIAIRSSLPLRKVN